LRVYYLTGAQFALSNLAMRRIKISRFSDLNDPFELMGVNVADKQHRIAFIETKKKINEKQGLICFSEAWKNPLMWGHYAEKHTGIGLGFDVPDELLVKVHYAKRLMKMKVDPVAGKPLPDEGFMNMLLRTKFSDWKYENEWRLFTSLDRSKEESGKYFYSFSDHLILREIILGPKCELPIERIRNIATNISPDIEVLKSRMAFTRFEVLESKSGSRLAKK
jgi:hypothetical protein